MLKRAIQDAFSTNCISGVPSLKAPYSGKVTRKLTMAPISAIQRTARSCSSRPSASRATPNTIGVQMARLKAPTLFFSLSAEPDETRHQHEHADDHRERVVVDVARLQAAGDAGEPAHQVRAAVDHGAVDDGLVAPLPQADAQQAGAAREHVLVEPVHVVLVLEQGVDRLEHALDAGG